MAVDVRVVAVDPQAPVVADLVVVVPAAVRLRVQLAAEPRPAIGPRPIRSSAPKDVP